MLLKSHILLTAQHNIQCQLLPRLYCDSNLWPSNHKPAFPISRLQTTQSGPRCEPQDLWIYMDTTSHGAMCASALIVTTWDSSWWTQCSDGKAGRAGQQHAASISWTSLWFDSENTRNYLFGESSQTHLCYIHFSSVVLHFKQKWRFSEQPLMLK